MRVEPYNLPAKYRFGSALFKKAEDMIRSYHIGNDFKFIHIRAVLDNSIKLADHYHANRNIVGWAALLHDIASIKYNDPTPAHAIKGAAEAKTYLRKTGLPAPIISEIAYCIREHITEGNPQTLEAKIVHAADNLAALDTFFDIIFSFCLRNARKDRNIDYLTGLSEGYEWATIKIHDTLLKISILDYYAMSLAEDKLAAAKLILDSMKPFLIQRPKSLNDPKTAISAFFEVVYYNCLEAAKQGGELNVYNGLYHGFYRIERIINNAWNSLSANEKEEYGELYRAEQIILRSIEPYLRYLT